MSDEQTAVIAHLLRRAGFGASFDELEQQADRPYSDVVEDLVNPEPRDIAETNAKTAERALTAALEHLEEPK